MAFQKKILWAVLMVGIVGGGCTPVHEASTPPVVESTEEAAPEASATASPTATGTVQTATPQTCSDYQLLFTKGDSTFYSACFDDKQIYFESLTSLTLDEPRIVAPNETSIILLNLGSVSAYDTTSQSVSLYNLTNRQTTSLDELSSIKNAYWATLSPGEEYIAYSVYIQEPNELDQRRLLIAHISTGTMSPPMSSQTLGFTEFENFLYPTWSPDGKQIVLYDRDLLVGYIVDIQCQTGTHLCLPEGTSRTIPLPEDIAITSTISWSPDGREFAAACKHRPGGSSAICVFNSEGDVLREFDASALGLDWLDVVTWSPDGNLLAFNASLTSSLRSSIYIINATDMSIYATLSSETEYYVYPIWVP